MAHHAHASGRPKGAALADTLKVAICMIVEDVRRQVMFVEATFRAKVTRPQPGAEDVTVRRMEVLIFLIPDQNGRKVEVSI